MNNWRHGSRVERQFQWGRVLIASLCILAAAAAAQPRTGSGSTDAVMDGVEIRRTTDGIPHLRAAHWRPLGVGIGYVQAQDALCTLAEAFVTYQGRRSWFFGAEAQPTQEATFGRPKNLELDFFFRSFADDAMLAQYRNQQPPELNDLIEGYAMGYNRYLAEARRAHGRGPQRPCINAAWVTEIRADDIYRRLYAAQVAAGYAHLIPQIVNAQPGQAKISQGLDVDLQARLAYRVGSQAGLGSNALAFGREATGEAAGVLFGNPHWYWGGPDRFYQMHMTIPGQLNVAGVAFLGVPVIMIGFNEHVAWSHTVSQARRFGLFDLTLDPTDPKRVQMDGRSEAMESRDVSVDVRGNNGEHHRLARTLYRTRFGPVLDLGHLDPAFSWGHEHALAVRDVNAQNFRVFRNFFYWNQARSLENFVDIQRREAAMPWVNTVAIGRADGRVWYSELGAVPAVPDALRDECATALSRGFASVDRATPFLDGSRSACDWRDDAGAAQPGAMRAAAMPALWREDYVANMNDSHWLTNVHQPLEGFPVVLGEERQALSLRSRLGHRLAQEVSQGPTRSAEALSQRLREATLTPRAYSAELFKDELLAQACTSAAVDLPAPLAQGGAGVPPRRVDVSRACEVLRQWSGKANPSERGVLLWEAFWARLAEIPAAELYEVAFSAEAPLETPRAPRGGERIAQALATAVMSLEDRGDALDAPLSTQRFVLSGGQSVPLYGGCHEMGYFTVACNLDGSSNPMGPRSHANSYLQVVHFDRQGVVAHTLLAHGQTESAVANGAGSAPVMRYARKAWLRFPFSESEIARNPGLQRQVLRPGPQGW